MKKEIIDFEELKKHKFIIIGYNHYNTLGLVRSLGENGIRPYVYLLKSNFLVVERSKYIGQVFYVDNYEQAYEKIVATLSGEEYKPFIYPCDDESTELFDSRIVEIESDFICSHAGNNERITYYTDKKNICSLAIKYGLKCAKTWEVNNGDIPSDIEYPVLTKPRTSYYGWKDDYHICHNEEELMEAYKSIKADNMLLQQYLTKKNELCLDGVVVNDGKDMLVAIASKYTYILPDYYSMEMKITNFENDKLGKSLKAMFEEVGYEGIFSVEFLIDENDDLWFLEINFRNSTWSYAATKLGMNLPMLWAYGMINKKYWDNPVKKIPKNYYAMTEIYDFSLRVLGKRINPIKWLGRLIRDNCKFVWNWKDLKPSIYYWTYAIKDRLKK